MTLLEGDLSCGAFSLAFLPISLYEHQPLPILPSHLCSLTSNILPKMYLICNFPYDLHNNSLIKLMEILHHFPSILKFLKQSVLKVFNSQLHFFFFFR